MKRLLLLRASRMFMAASLLFAVNSFAQTLAPAIELSVTRYSEAPNTDLLHVYSLQAVNTSSQPVTLKIKTTNKVCDKKTSVDLSQEVYWENEGFSGMLTNNTKLITIPAHSTEEFIIRTNRPLNTPLNTWNCTQVEALDTGDHPVSNSIIIESFIPDPKDFR